MEPKPIPKSIDADIVQCKADVLRARKAALAAQKGKQSGVAPGPQNLPAEPNIQPQGPDEGMQTLLQMAVESQDTPAPAKLTEAGQSRPLPPALRPIEQVCVGNDSTVRPLIPATDQLLNQADSSETSSVSGNFRPANSFSESDSNNLSTPQTPPVSHAEPTPKKLRIPRFDDIVSWGKRILEDRPKTETPATRSDVKSEDLNRLQKELDQARLAGRDLNSQVIRLQTELTSLNHSLGRARDQLRENADTAEQFYDQIEQLQKKTDEQSRQINDLKEQLSRKQSELEEAVRNLQDSTQIQAQSQEQIQSLQAQLATRNKEQAEFQSRLSQLQSVLEQTQARLQNEVKLRQELQSATDQASGLAEQIQILTKARDQAVQDLADSEKTVAEIRSQLETRQQELTWFRDELKTSQILADQRQERIESMGKVSQELTQTQTLAEERRVSIEELLGRQKEYQGRIEQLEREILRLQSESASLQEHHRSQVQQLDEARTETSRLRDRIQSQEQAQSAVETELAQARLQAAENEQTRRNLQDQIRELTDQLESARHQGESVRLELADLESRQHGLQEQLQIESFLANDLESESEIPPISRSDLDVTQLETDMSRQLEPDRRMEWLLTPDKRPSVSPGILDSSDKRKTPTADEVSLIPDFNLAEQILAEQRRISSERRQRSANSSKLPVRAQRPRGINHVVQSLSPSESKAVEAVSVSSEPHESAWTRPVESLNPIQREILAEIVAAEINRFCGW